MLIDDRQHGMSGRCSGSDFSRVLGDARGLIASDVAQCFEQSRSPDGKPFAPLKHHVMRKPLVKSGRMLQSQVAAVMAGLVQPNRLTITAREPFYWIFTLSARARCRHARPWG